MDKEIIYCLVGLTAGIATGRAYYHAQLQEMVKYTLTVMDSIHACCFEKKEVEINSTLKLRDYLKEYRELKPFKNEDRAALNRIYNDLESKLSLNKR